MYQGTNFTDISSLCSSAAFLKVWLRALQTKGVVINEYFYHERYTWATPLTCWVRDSLGINLRLPIFNKYSILTVLKVGILLDYMLTKLQVKCVNLGVVTQPLWTSISVSVKWDQYYAPQRLVVMTVSLLFKVPTKCSASVQWLL